MRRALPKAASPGSLLLRQNVAEGIAHVLSSPFGMRQRLTTPYQSFSRSPAALSGARPWIVVTSHVAFLERVEGRRPFQWEELAAEPEGFTVWGRQDREQWAEVGREYLR